MTNFGPEYCKIQTAFKRDERNVIVPGDWTLPEFAYLADKAWRWTEKVDGTNIRLHWDGVQVTIGGRTDNAQFGKPLYEMLDTLINGDVFQKKAVDTFNGDATVLLFGEGYGAGGVAGNG